METSARHIIVGSFVLIFVIGIFGFVAWLARVEIDREFADYYIFFDEAVSGLSVGGSVRYNGIPVGAVTAIEIDPSSPSRVRVTVELGRQIKIREDTVATLELQGITGVSFVQLSGGSPNATILRPTKIDEIPVIESERSAIQELFAGGPELVNRIISLVNAFTKMVGPDNRLAVTNILVNTDNIIARLAERGPAIEQLINDLRRSTKDLSGAGRELSVVITNTRKTMESADATLSVARGALSGFDYLIENEARPTLKSIRRSSDELSSLVERVDELLAKNSESLDAFAGEGLIEFTRFIEEARQLVVTSSRLMENLQSDPTQFLLGGQQGGLEVD